MRNGYEQKRWRRLRDSVCADERGDARHAAFAPDRVNASREFFRISKDQVIPILKAFNDLQDITCTIIGERKVLYNDEETSLTKITTALKGATQSIQPTGFWTANGRNLLDIYNETYPVAEEEWIQDKTTPNLIMVIYSRWERTLP